MELPSQPPVRRSFFARFGLGLLLIVAAACSQNVTDGPSTGATGTGGAASGPCPPCVSDQDCGGGAVCAQLGADSYCAPACPNGDECASDRTCAPVSKVDGTQVSACVIAGQACSPADGSGGGPSSDMCGPLVGPSVQASCSSCKAGTTCQTNGCYGGWWCNTTTNKCQSPPPNCGSTGGPVNGGPPVTGTVDGSGGKVSRLLFAVVGDTRPAVIDDTAGYPSAIVGKIFGDVEAFKPHPAFVVATGDYQFSKPFGNQANAQLDLYLAARNQFTGPLFAAMGNHECTGATASNCGAGAQDGVTKTYQAFLAKMLAPIGQSQPYYSIRVDATDGSWTSKLVFVAANAWSSAQASWLDSTLAQSTTYTFVVRHESELANTAPGVTPSEQIMAQHPYTLSIVGHTHTYEHPTPREIIVGNGGAPLTGGKNYGFAVLSQRAADGAIVVDMVDYATGLSDKSFHFAVKPNGSPAAP